jgi:predicted permease
VYRQLLTEHALLVAGGGVVAVMVASSVSIWLDSVFPTGASESGLGTRGIVLLVASAVLAGLLSTVLPAVQASPLGLTAGWRTGSGVTMDRASLRSTLLVAQLAFALVLAVGAGLFVRSVEFVKRDLGYDLERVLVATLDLQRAGIRREVQMREAFDSMLSAVRRLPEVEAASLTTAVPLGFGRSYRVTPDSGNGRNPVYASVSPEYFSTLATRLEEGRAFTADDAAASLPVMIVDRALAQALRPEGDALGHCLEVGRGRPCVHIIGISEPRRFTQLTRPDGEAFLPLAQTPGRETIPQALLIRVRTSPAESLSQVRAAIQSASDNLPVAEIRRLEDLVNVRARSWRVGATVFSLFGTMAMALAALGIYGAVAFSVRQRRPEIGVRMALGASPRDILALFLRRVIVIVAIGWTAGIVAASLASGAIEGLLYGVTAADPRTYVITSVILIGAGLAGCIVPAVRATQVNPSVTVREETA